MYEEAPEGMIREVYLTEGLLQHLKSRQEKASLYIEEKLRKTGYEMGTEEVFERMSDTRTPQGILTVLRFCRRTGRCWCCWRICRIREIWEPSFGQGREQG